MANGPESHLTPEELAALERLVPRYREELENLRRLHSDPDAVNTLERVRQELGDVGATAEDSRLNEQAKDAVAEAKSIVAGKPLFVKAQEKVVTFFIEKLPAMVIGCTMGGIALLGGEVGWMVAASLFAANPLASVAGFAIGLAAVGCGVWKILGSALRDELR